MQKTAKVMTNELKSDSFCDDVESSFSLSVWLFVFPKFRKVESFFSRTTESDGLKKRQTDKRRKDELWLYILHTLWPMDRFFSEREKVGNCFWRIFATHKTIRPKVQFSLLLPF